MATLQITEQMRVENLKTGKYRYFTLICGEWVREPWDKWQRRRIAAVRLECFHSATRGQYRREYATLRMN